MTGTAPDVRSRLRAALATAGERLGRAGVPSPSVDARALIARAADERGPLVMLDELPASFEDELERLLVRREAREPLQLILGTAPFRRLEIEVRPGVFIPRPETELAIDLLLAHHARHPVRRLADLCTGSGALAAAALDELPGAEVLAVDVDPAAVALARRNRAHAEGCDASGESGAQGEPPARGRVLQADVRDAAALAGVRGLDAVVSNPPYVPPDAVPREAEVRLHDPALALYGGGEDGLDLPRAVLERAGEMLAPGGLLVMEHADVQGEAVREAAKRTGCFTALRTVQDLTGRDRFLVARRLDVPRPGASHRGAPRPGVAVARPTGPDGERVGD